MRLQRKDVAIVARSQRDCGAKAMGLSEVIDRLFAEEMVFSYIDKYSGTISSAQMHDETVT